MARTPEFEDMRDQEWPENLQKLRRAALHAYHVYDELDDIHTANTATVKDINERVTIYELIGRAGALLRDLRAEGLRQLAAWEESQKTEEEDYQRKRIENWNAVADGLQPPHPSEY